MTSGNGCVILCRGGRKGKRGPRTDNRRFLNALLWMARSGARWRDLPAHLGDYETVKRRYYRWIEMGVLDGILEALAREADLEWLMTELDHRARPSACRRRLMAKTHRSTRNDHLHRNARLVTRRSAAMTLGITGGLQNRRAAVCRNQGAGSRNRKRLAGPRPDPANPEALDFRQVRRRAPQLPRC